jgi:hypothetical protein
MYFNKSHIKFNCASNGVNIQLVFLKTLELLLNVMWFLDILFYGNNSNFLYIQNCKKKIKIYFDKFQLWIILLKYILLYKKKG